MHDVFDWAFKRLMTASDPAIVRLVNGLFHHRFPLETPVIRLSTEQATGIGTRRAADVVFEIAGYRFVIEAQMRIDRMMARRVWEYGLDHATIVETPERATHVVFPQVRIVYLEHRRAPKGHSLGVVFPDGSLHQFIVPAVRLAHLDLADYTTGDLTLLAPFSLTLLRHKVKQASHEERLALVDEVRTRIAEFDARLQDEVRAGTLAQEDVFLIYAVADVLIDQTYKAGIPELKEAQIMPTTFKTLFETALEEGLERGREEGLAEGRMETERRIARNGLAMGWSVDDIAQLVSLDREQIEALRTAG